MSQTHRIAQLLVASWVLSTEDKRIPTSHGLLDNALKRAREAKAFPAWMWAQLHFADSRIGLQCVELPSILDWAQSAALTSAPNPSYRFTELQISGDAARVLLKRLGVDESDARSWGEMLKASVDELQAEQDMHAVAAV